MSHTPLPWTDHQRIGHGPSRVISGPDEANAHFYVAMAYGPDAEDNAAIIVKAVNAHSEAIELLTAVTQSDGNVSDLLWNQIQAALKKWGEA